MKKWEFKGIETSVALSQSHWAASVFLMTKRIYGWVWIELLLLNKTKKASLNVLTNSYFDDGITFSVEIDTNKSALAENGNNRLKYMTSKFKLNYIIWSLR